MDMEIDRRSFVESLVLLPFGVFLVRCSSSDGSSGTGDAPAAAPRLSGTSAVYSSSSVSGHFHTFSVALADFSSPPSAGVSGQTSSESGHVHVVSVSAADLQSVQAGSSVRVVTSSSAGHDHVFTFVKVSSASSTGSTGATY